MRRHIPAKYIPKSLTPKDRRAQHRMIQKSRTQYKKKHGNRFYTRKRVASFKSRKSNHIATARKIYGVQTISPNKELAAKTGCSIAALKQIVKKGEGAYYSSGSRPNQTPQSWGLARLASAITAGKASKVDFHILAEGCNHKKKAYQLANKNNTST